MSRCSFVVSYITENNENCEKWQCGLQDGCTLLAREAVSACSWNCVFVLSPAIILSHYLCSNIFRFSSDRYSAPLTHVMWNHIMNWIGVPKSAYIVIYHFMSCWEDLMESSPQRVSSFYQYMAVLAAVFRVLGSTSLVACIDLFVTKIKIMPF